MFPSAGKCVERQNKRKNANISFVTDKESSIASIYLLNITPVENQQPTVQFIVIKSIISSDFFNSGTWK